MEIWGSHTRFELRRALYGSWPDPFCRSRCGVNRLLAVPFDRERSKTTAKAPRSPRGAKGFWILRKRREALGKQTLACLGAPRSGALPSEMKGDHPEEWSSKTGSEAPCVMPRGVQQKRGQDASGGKPEAANLRAERAANPDVAS